MGISLAARSDIVAFLLLRKYPFHGNLDLLSFLERTWDLASMKAIDHRHTSAYGDIRTHMISFNDWDYSYLLYDYLHILESSDEVFISFLENCLHPLVISDDQRIDEMQTLFNTKLAPDGYRIEAVAHRLGRPLFKVNKTAVKVEPIKASPSVAPSAYQGRTKVFICYSHRDVRHLK